MLTHYQKIKRTKRIMDIIVYSSSIIDIVIAILAVLSYLNIGHPEIYILPVDYALSVTVGLTVVLGALLMYLKHYQSIMAGFLRITNHVKYGIFNLHRFSVAFAKWKNSRYRKH